MEEITTFLQVVVKMIETVHSGLLSVGMGDYPLYFAMIVRFLIYAPLYVISCLIVAFAYNLISKKEKR